MKAILLLLVLSMVSVTTNATYATEEITESCQRLAISNVSAIKHLYDIPFEMRGHPVALDVAENVARAHAQGAAICEFYGVDVLPFDIGAWSLEPDYVD